MNLANKSFRDNKTGEVIKIIDSFEDIAILENKEKISVNRLLNPSFYTEQIDPTNFFNNQGAYNSLAEKIKNIPTDNLRDNFIDSSNIVMVDGVQMPSSSESAVILSDPEQEKIELARKYGANIDNQNSIQNQNNAFAKILGDENDLPKVEAKKTGVTINNTPQIESGKMYIHPQIVEDPIINMFKGVKRNISFKMNIEISNKIPRIDFIEMMEDSYEVSIIDYLAEEFTQNLLKDPSQIKEVIKDKIKKIVYGANLPEQQILEESYKHVPIMENNSSDSKKIPAKKSTKRTSKKEEVK
jgi:hypothetical protein